jgi:hypothetical protein
MNKNNAKEYLSLVQAFADGKTIQILELTTNKWHDFSCDELSFSLAPHCYRIKPNIILRPWLMEEVPVGALARHKNVLSKFMILGVDDKGILFPNFDEYVICLSFKNVMIYYEHSTDGGKTWLPCGVMEENKQQN